jgi:hypothetical protein
MEVIAVGSYRIAVSILANVLRGGFDSFSNAGRI